MADNIELTNYAALDSTSKEAELQESADKPAVKKFIMRRRALQALAVISTFFIGLIIKLTVKHH